MTITNVFLVRHAHSNYSTDEWNRPLSEKGRLAIEALPKVFSKIAINVVISSPYRRAVETVEGINRNLAVILIEDFKERTISLKKVDDFHGEVLKAWVNPYYKLAGGESNKEAQTRGVTALQQIIRKYAGKNIIIGTHGNLMALILNEFDSSFDFHFWQRLTMPDVYQLTFKNEELTSIKRV